MDIMLQRILELVGTKHGSSQELVQALGLSKNTVTDWKAGRLKSYPKYAPQIAAYYGVSLEWLSGLTDEKTKKTPSEDGAANTERAKAHAMLDSLSEESVAKVIAMIELLGL